MGGFSFPAPTGKIRGKALRQHGGAGADIVVGRFRVSENYVQKAGNLDGLECRWQDISSRHGETVSVMVDVLIDDNERAPRWTGSG